MPYENALANHRLRLAASVIIIIAYMHRRRQHGATPDEYDDKRLRNIADADGKQPARRSGHLAACLASNI